MIGRNELCPCGSGKKYKKCCLQKNQLGEFTRNKIIYAKGLYGNLENKIVEYSNRLVFKDDKDNCKKYFYISDLDNKNIDKLFKTYYIQDYVTSNKKVIANMYIEEYGSMLSKTHKSILVGMINSYLSIFEVEDIQMTKTVIKDIILEEKIVVEDIDAFRNLSVGEYIIGRPTKVQGMNMFIDECVKIAHEDVQKIKVSINNQYTSNKEIFKTKMNLLENYSEIIYRCAQQIILSGKLSLDEEIISSSDKNKEGYKKEESNADIIELLKDKVEEKYLQQGLDLWSDFIKEKKTVKGSESGWAAAVEYFIKKDAGETITQVQISQKYEISPRTLGKRLKEIKAS